MRIAVPVADYHPGNTGVYVERAFQRLGHDARILSQEEFYGAFAPNHFDLYFCVDSGRPLDLWRDEVLRGPADKMCFWFIDYRHNKNRPDRVPNDELNARLIGQLGGWVFQAQYEDFVECRDTVTSRCSWLPLAADANVWCSDPPEEKVFDVGFCGHLWDHPRADARMRLTQAELLLGFPGSGAAWKEAAALLLRRSRIGFNISAFYGTPVAYDVNMRVFETLACGVPLLTNDVPSLKRIFADDVPFIRVYRSIDELVEIARNALNDATFLSSGAQARDWILRCGTYDVRVAAALETWRGAGQHSS